MKSSAKESVRASVLTRRNRDFKGARLLVGLILLTAFILRVWRLDIKPPHFDEGINGSFVVKMWKDGFYSYDPTNFHGPLYFYYLQLGELLMGRSLFTMRFVTGLLSVGICYVIAMHRRFFGSAAIWAAALVAISTAFVFYSRYAIHESMFILLQVCFTYGFFLWREKPSLRAVTWMTVGFFGAFAVKETFFIFFGTFFIALLCEKFAQSILPAAVDDWSTAESREATESVAGAESEQLPALSDVIAIVMLGGFFAVMAFTGFFMHPHGLADMFRAFAFWTKTGVAPSGHDKDFLYWIDLMKLYECPFLLALVLSPFVFFFTSRRGRVFVLASIGVWLAYSLIPYKTPWLIINILWPLSFVFGFLMQETRAILVQFRIGWIRPFAVLGIFWLIVMSTLTMNRLNFHDFTKVGEPYVYVQTTLQLKNVVDIINRRVKKFPEDRNMKIEVLNRDTWPMPWVFSLFPHVVYTPAAMVDVFQTKVILVDDSTHVSVEKRMLGKYWVLPFQVRDSYEFGKAYLEFNMFDGFVPPNTPIYQRSDL